MMVGKVLTAVAISATLILAACNTVRGAGEDVQSVANAGDEVI